MHSVVNILMITFFCGALFAGNQEGEFLLCSKKNSVLCVKTIQQIQAPKAAATLLTCDRGEQVVLKTSDEYEIPVVFFDRGKDKVVVLGQGFPAEKETMLPEVNMLNDYDVIIFDYRWSNLTAFLLKISHWLSLGRSLVGDGSKDVLAVLNFLQSKKKYKEIVGLGQCYSCYTFLRTQYIQEKIPDSIRFTKLLLDSCWPSLFSFTRSLQYDPLLAMNPQESGTHETVKKFLALPGVRNLISEVLFLFIPDISIKKYLEKISCPMLFFHGGNDLLIPYETTFLPMFVELVPEEQALAVIMPAGHVSLSMSHRDFYKKVCDLFIEDGRQGVQNFLI